LDERATAGKGDVRRDPLLHLFIDRYREIDDGRRALMFAEAGVDSAGAPWRS
jgi:hypothetical protein